MYNILAGKADVFIELLMFAWAGRCWACLKYLHCFALLCFVFFLSHRVSWRWSHSQRWLQDTEITPKLCWNFALCLYQVFCSTVCFTHTSASWTKTKPCDPLSLLWSIKSQWFLTAGVLQLGSKYGFRGNSTSSLDKKKKQQNKQPLPLPPP